MYFLSRARAELLAVQMRLMWLAEPSGVYSPLSADEPTKPSAVMYWTGFAQCGNGCVCVRVRASS